MKITFKDIEGGIYHATVSMVKEDCGPYGPFLRIVFTITDEELEHFRFAGFIKPSPLKQSRFYKWITNILGQEPLPEFYTEDIIGKECVVVLSKKRKSYTVTEVIDKNSIPR